MSPPASNHRVDDDEVRGWVAEAGDFRVEPRPEHREQVLQALRESVARPPVDVVVIPPEQVETPLGIGMLRIVAVAGLFSAAIAGIVYLIPRQSQDWTAVAQALQEQKWIHCIATGPDGFRQETWFSPRFEILATKYQMAGGIWGAEFHDLAADVKTEYVPEENTIYRLPETQVRTRNSPHELAFFHFLRRGEDFKGSPFPGSEVVDRRVREAVEQGTTWKVHELTVRGNGQPTFECKMTIRVAPPYKLPMSWDVVGNGMTLRQALDYPTSGPRDILALGVPSAAKIDDQIPQNDLDQVVNRLRVGRNRFDDYCAFVWTDKMLNRVWRKGRRWRVELGIPRNIDPRFAFDLDLVPDDAGPEWWQRHEALLVFRPEAIFDGQTITYYHYPPRPSNPGQLETWQHSHVSTHYPYATPDDPPVPWPHLMPEHIGHPQISLTEPNWEFFVDPKPDDGPPNTLRLRVRDLREEDPRKPDIYRLWIGPRQSDLALRVESTIHEPFGPTSINGNPTGILPNYPRRANRAPRSVKDTTSTQSDGVDIKVIEDLAQSPAGFWYPTRVIRKTSKSLKQEVIHYALDFGRTILDELFLPVR